MPDLSELTAAVSVAVGLTPYLSAVAEPVIATDGFAWQGWDLSAGWRQMALSLGHQPIGYGFAQSGGIVLAGDEPVTRVQLQTLAPFRLPGPLRGLGLASFHGFGGWLEEPRHAGDPYIWGIAASLRPHSRITLSIHRASILAGDSVGTALTPRNFFRTFIGHNLLGFENEVVAAELRLRLPTERFLPITAYTEWGAEDAAGAWRDVPGRLYGMQVPAVPGLPQVAFGMEYVSFAGSCCGNPPWYRHAPHTGGWVVEERPMGHPLGGQGRQTSVFSHLDLADSRLRVDAHVFRRQREGENLFVPGREGSSTGFALRSSFRFAPRGDLTLAVTGETGQRWREEAASIGLRTFF